jgi:hypothetical protein
METLCELAVREAEISAEVAHVSGVMDAKEAALASAGVFAAYADLLAAYVSLFGSKDAGAEALARAAFLLWYEVAEPACFSGVRDLPRPLVEATLAQLDAVSAQGDLCVASRRGLPCH